MIYNIIDIARGVTEYKHLLEVLEKTVEVEISIIATGESVQKWEIVPSEDLYRQKLAKSLRAAIKRGADLRTQNRIRAIQDAPRTFDHIRYLSFIAATKYYSWIYYTWDGPGSFSMKATMFLTTTGGLTFIETQEIEVLT